MAEFSERALADVRAALAEDLGAGDLSAPLARADAKARGALLCRSATVLCGTAWFEGCFRELDARADFAWRFRDGDAVPAGAEVAEVRGLARALLAAERSALNFLQTLSATAAASRRLRDAAGKKTVVADTRKTIPKLRFAQKYAVRVGGCANHRAGLFDEILVKENHIAMAGGVAAAVRRALALGVGAEKVQVEVRSLAEMESAAAAGAARILLDNFSLADLRLAVRANRGRAELEASGGADEKNIAAMAATGVDRISSGAMTKNVQAADFSFLLSAAES